MSSVPSSGIAPSLTSKPMTSSVWKRNCVMSVHLAVPIRSTARVHVELAAEPIHLPFQVAILEFGGQAAAAAPEEEVAEDQPAKVRGVCDTTRRRKIRQRADDDDEVFRRNRKDERHQDRALGVIHREREQNAEERTRGTYRDGVIGRPGDRKWQQRHENRRDRGTDSCHGIVADEKLCAPQAL